jgi:hypothetical protein
MQSPASSYGFPGESPTKKKKHRLRNVFLALVALIALIVVISVVASGGDDKSTSSSSTAADGSAVQNPTTNGNKSSTLGTTRENPAPIGTTMTLKDRDNGDLDVTVNSFTLDGTQAVLTANQFNKAPAAGTRFSLANLTFTYHAGVKKQTTNVLFAAGMSLFGQSATEVSTSSCSAVVKAAPLDEMGDLLDGGKQTGNVCFLVTDADAAAPIVLRVKEEFCVSNCDIVWMKLQ